MLRRGRGRGNNRGDKISPNEQPRIPAIPPFPFHQQQFSASRNLQYYGPRGVGNPPPQRLCNPVSIARGLPIPVARGLCFRGSRGFNNPVSQGLGFDYGSNGPRFPVPISEEARAAEVRTHFIPSLPKPRPNTITQQEWDVLNHNGRPVHKCVCAVVCCCTFGEGDAIQRIFSFCCSGTSPSEHAEKKAIEQVIMYENASGRDLRKVILVSSRSPCIPCAEVMIKFVKSRRFSMNLYFTALQKEINPYRSGISLLSSSGIPMRIADDYIWSYLRSLLATCEGEPRTTFSDGSKVNISDRNGWDEVWSQQLEAVLNHDVPNILNCQSLNKKFNVLKEIMLKPMQMPP